jgi:hypothetical protein
MYCVNEVATLTLSPNGWSWMEVKVQWSASRTGPRALALLSSASFASKVAVVVATLPIPSITEHSKHGLYSRPPEGM